MLNASAGLLPGVVLCTSLSVSKRRLLWGMNVAVRVANVRLPQSSGSGLNGSGLVPPHSSVQLTPPRWIHVRCAVAFARPTAEPVAHSPLPFFRHLPETVSEPGMPSARVSLRFVFRWTQAASSMTTLLVPRSSYQLEHSWPGDPDLVCHSTS